MLISTIETKNNLFILVLRLVLATKLVIFVRFQKLLAGLKKTSLPGNACSGRDGAFCNKGSV